MAHFAKLDDENNVIQVLVVSDEYDTDELGQEYLANFCGFGGRWIKTSYNTLGGVHQMGGVPLRKNYAGLTSVYDPVRDAFYQKQPYQSWTLNEETCHWEPPTPMPTNGMYKWSEEEENWVKVV
jgi:hypothetical protein